LMERVVGAHLTEAQFEKLAAEVASRKKDPYVAVNQILARAGLGEKS
jgi:collagenase-like PrtC family protease